MFLKVLISTFVDNNYVRHVCCRIREKVFCFGKGHSEHNHEVADRYISYSNVLIIFTADSSKLSSITMFSGTYKLFLAKLHVFLGYRSHKKGKILFHISPPESNDCNTSNRLDANFFGYNQNLLTSHERTIAHCRDVRALGRVSYID